MAQTGKEASCLSWSFLPGHAGRRLISGAAKRLSFRLRAMPRDIFPSQLPGALRSAFLSVTEATFCGSCSSGRLRWCYCCCYFELRNARQKLTIPVSRSLTTRFSTSFSVAHTTIRTAALATMWLSRCHTTRQSRLSSTCRPRMASSLPESSSQRCV